MSFSLFTIFFVGDHAELRATLVIGINVYVNEHVDVYALICERVNMYYGLVT